jgi:hypothetical protein
MKRLFLLLLLCSACQKCPIRTPPYTWHPLLSDETIFSRGKVRRRPLYKAKVPISWKRDLNQELITYNLSDQSKLTVCRLPEEEISPLTGSALKTACFAGYFWHEQSTAYDHLIWTLKPDPSILKGLKSSGQNEEEELFFKQMCATVQIEVSGPKEEIASRDEEIQQFLNSFTFIQGVPKA